MSRARDLAVMVTTIIAQKVENNLILAYSISNDPRKFPGNRFTALLLLLDDLCL